MNPTVTLEYRLEDLPTAQHGAGLAGLVVMVNWLASKGYGGVRALDRVDPAAVTVTLDREGLAGLLDAAYAASEELVGFSRAFAGKEPVRIEELTEGKKIKRQFYYPVIVPRGAFLAEWYSPPWIKLWRDMLWQILRGVPAQRLPYIARATGKSDKLVGRTWTEITAQRRLPVELNSTFLIGTQARSAEGVPMLDTSRNRFLLHFMPFVLSIFVPLELQPDGTSRLTRRFVLGVPDIVNVPLFCHALEGVARARGAETRGHVPQDAVIDVPAVGAIETLFQVNQRIGTKSVYDGLCAVEAVAVERPGNTVNILDYVRLSPPRERLDEYGAIAGKYRDGRFRYQRMVNFLEGAPWYTQLDRMGPRVATSSWFREDLANALSEEAMSEETRRLFELIRRLTWRYLRTKRLDAESLRRHVSRASDFARTFEQTVLSVPQRLSDDDRLVLAEALLDRPEHVRTLMSLAVMAEPHTRKEDS